MDVEYWLDSWQTGQIGFNQSKPNPLMKKYFSSLSLEKGAVVFVPLCGKSIDMVWLLEKGFQVVGVELSQLAIESFFNEFDLAFSRKMLGNGLTAYQGEGITLLHGDFFSLSAKDIGPIQAVYDKASLVAFPPSKQRSYQKQLAQLVPDTLPILLIILNYDQALIDGPPFSWSKEALHAHFGETYYLTQLEAKRREASPSLKHRGLDQYLEEIYIVKKVDKF